MSLFITSHGCRCLLTIMHLQAFNHWSPHWFVPFKPLFSEISPAALPVVTGRAVLYLRESSFHIQGDDEAPCAPEYSFMVIYPTGTCESCITLLHCREHVSNKHLLVNGCLLMYSLIADHLNNMCSVWKYRKQRRAAGGDNELTWASFRLCIRIRITMFKDAYERITFHCRYIKTLKNTHEASCFGDVYTSLQPS